MMEALKQRPPHPRVAGGEDARRQGLDKLQQVLDLSQAQRGPSSSCAVGIRSDIGKKWNVEAKEVPQYRIHVTLRHKDTDEEYSIMHAYVPPAGSRFYNDDDDMEATMAQAAEMDVVIRDLTLRPTASFAEETW